MTTPPHSFRRLARIAAWLIALGMLIEAFKHATQTATCAGWLLGLWAWLVLFVCVDTSPQKARARRLLSVTLGTAFAATIVYLQADELRTYGPLTDQQIVAAIARASARADEVGAHPVFQVTPLASFDAAKPHAAELSVVDDIDYARHRYIIHPIALAVQLRIANISPTQQRIDGFLIEEQQPDESWKKLCNYDPYGDGVYAYARQAQQLKEVGQNNNLNFRLRGKVLEPQDSTEGWAWLECPPDAACNFNRLRIQVLSGDGDLIVQDLSVHPVPDVFSAAVRIGDDRIDLTTSRFEIRSNCR